jgi:hypothetical protein
MDVELVVLVIPPDYAEARRWLIANACCNSFVSPSQLVDFYRG